MIRTLIVDDEPAARRGIRQHLLACPGAEVVGECTHGREAVAAIEALAPDLVFLDVQMPELDGFDVIAAVGATLTSSRHYRENLEALFQGSR